MSFFERSLVGKQIDGVYVDSEVTYIMLNDGTHVTGVQFPPPAQLFSGRSRAPGDKGWNV